jgi:hypothetical protein
VSQKNFFNELLCKFLRELFSTLGSEFVLQ